MYDNYDMATISQPDWFVPLWLVTYVDIHRTVKVQEIVHALLDVVAEFPNNSVFPHFDAIKNSNRALYCDDNSSLKRY